MGFFILFLIIHPFCLLVKQFLAEGYIDKIGLKLRGNGGLASIKD